MQSSKIKRTVKIKDKDKGKVKPCETIILEEDLPPAPPRAGKQLADVIARLSPEELGLVFGHLLSSTVQDWVQSIGAQQTAVLCGWRFFPSVYFFYMDFVTHSVCVSIPILNGSCKAASHRFDPMRAQRRERDAAASPRCDPMRGQRGKQKSDVGLKDAGSVCAHSSVAGRGAGLRPSGLALTRVSLLRVLRR